MANNFIKLQMFDKSGSVLINKNTIVFIRQIGIGNGTNIKVSSGELILVAQTEDQILSILEKA